MALRLGRIAAAVFGLLMAAECLGELAEGGDVRFCQPKTPSLGELEPPPLVRAARSCTRCGLSAWFAIRGEASGDGTPGAASPTELRSARRRQGHSRQGEASEGIGMSRRMADGFRGLEAGGARGGVGAIA